MKSQRRTSERQLSDGEKVAWGPASGGHLRPAHVQNVSESGIALTVDSDSPAAHGDAIRVLDKHGTHPRRARVVRLHADGENLRHRSITLGCRWITSTDRRERRMGGRNHPHRVRRA
ncbi:MAG: PilZ domain-containing protein [Planctomycetota bacterium]